jgi:8-oxo-dGTP diphosphatase
MTRAAVEAALLAIEPCDDAERTDRADALAWVRSGAGIWRTAKPATPPEHLVSYFLLVDPDRAQCLLVHHRNAGMWLPTGGHVEPYEDPAATVRRECREELGVEALLEATPLTSNPLFVTRRTTVGVDAGHVDVSLWYVCRADATAPLTPDPAEFHEVRWWGLDEAASAEPGTTDPNLPRFVAKLVGGGR